LVWFLENGRVQKIPLNGNPAPEWPRPARRLRECDILRVKMTHQTAIKFQSAKEER
jgi:hypothetical protein